MQYLRKTPPSVLAALRVLGATQEHLQVRLRRALDIINGPPILIGGVLLMGCLLSIFTTVTYVLLDFGTLLSNNLVHRVRSL